MYHAIFPFLSRKMRPGKLYGQVPMWKLVFGNPAQLMNLSCNCLCFKPPPPGEALPLTTSFQHPEGFPCNLGQNRQPLPKSPGLGLGVSYTLLYSDV